MVFGSCDQLRESLRCRGGRRLIVWWGRSFGSGMMAVCVFVGVLFGVWCGS